MVLGIDYDIENISTAGQLAEYLRLLEQNLRDNPDEWENLSLSHFIESISAWVDDGGLGDESDPLKAVAHAMTAGKFYE